MHEVAPAAEYEPAEQATGELEAEATAEPAGEIVQMVAPAAEYHPRAQATGAEEIDGHADPAGQIAQAAELVAPAESKYLPLEQEVQMVDEAAAQVPGVHCNGEELIDGHW